MRYLLVLSIFWNIPVITMLLYNIPKGDLIFRIPILTALIIGTIYNSYLLGNLPNKSKQ